MLIESVFVVSRGSNRPQVEYTNCGFVTTMSSLEIDLECSFLGCSEVCRRGWFRENVPYVLHSRMLQVIAIERTKRLRATQI